MSVQEFVCLEISYGKRCGNAGAQRNHQKTLKEPSIQSSSLLRFLKKRGPPKKMAVELRSITRKPRQIKLSMRPRSFASTAPLFDAQSASVQITYSKVKTAHAIQLRNTRQIWVPFLRRRSYFALWTRSPPNFVLLMCSCALLQFLEGEVFNVG